jgi:hypothetical protein
VLRAIGKGDTETNSWEGERGRRREGEEQRKGGRERGRRGEREERGEGTSRGAAVGS